MAEQKTTPQDPFAGLGALEGDYFPGKKDEDLDDTLKNEMGITIVDPDELKTEEDDDSGNSGEAGEEQKEKGAEGADSKKDAKSDDNPEGKEGAGDGGEGTEDKGAKLWGSLTSVLESASVFSELGDDEKEEFGTIKSEADLLRRFEREKEKAVAAGIAAEVEKFQSGETKQLVEFLEAGGTARDFVQFKQEEFDWSAIQWDSVKYNDNHLATIVVEGMRAQGISDEKIGKMLKNYTDAGVLQDQAEIQLEALGKRSTERKAAKLKALEDARLDNLEKDKKMQASIKKQVLEQDIAGFNPSKSIRDKFLKYITDTDAEGKTAYQKKEEGMSDDEKLKRRLILQFLDFNNFDFDKMMTLTKSKATSELASQLAAAEESGSLVTKNKNQVSQQRQSTSKLDLDVLEAGLGG